MIPWFWLFNLCSRSPFKESQRRYCTMTEIKVKGRVLKATCRSKVGFHGVQVEVTMLVILIDWPFCALRWHYTTNRKYLMDSFHSLGLAKGDKMHREKHCWPSQVYILIFGILTFLYFDILHILIFWHLCIFAFVHLLIFTFWYSVVLK